jgi:hypothetical protein
VDAANLSKHGLEFAHVGRLEADRLAVTSSEQDVVLLGQQLDADDPVEAILLFLAF